MTAYITARNTARRTRQSHARYLSWLTAQGELVTVEQRRRLEDLREAANDAQEAWQDARIEHFRAHGIEVAAA